MSGDPGFVLFWTSFAAYAAGWPGGVVVVLALTGLWIVWPVVVRLRPAQPPGDDYDLSEWAW